MRTSISSILAGLLLLSVIGGLCIVLYFLEHSRTELRAEQRAAAQLRLRETSLTQLERELKETISDREELSALLIEPSAVIQFLSLIETLGVSHNTEVSTVSIDVAEESPLLDALKIEIKASGSLVGVLHVLELLETLPYVSEVMNTSITSSEGETGLLWEGDFTLLIAQHKKI